MSVKFNSFCELDVVGTVTKDPEMKYTPEGKAVTTIDVAYNEYIGKSDDQASATVPMWIRLTAWEKDAETLNNYLHKGDTLHAKCRIKFDHQTGSPRLYQRSDGTVAASYEASIKECTVISKNKNGTNGNGAPSNGGGDFEPQGQQFVNQPQAQSQPQQQYVPQQPAANQPQYQQPVNQPQYQQPQPPQFNPQQGQQFQQPQQQAQQPAPQQPQPGRFTVPPQQQQQQPRQNRSW